MFSALESCISRIYKPLNTMVISPIESVKAYSDQSVEDAIFLRKSEVGSLKSAQKIAYWSDGFKACFSKTDKKIKAKCMSLSRLNKMSHCWWLIFVKIIGKFWEVADFREILTNG